VLFRTRVIYFYQNICGAFKCFEIVFLKYLKIAFMPKLEIAFMPKVRNVAPHVFPFST
jgi:hypothetical protein